MLQIRCIHYILYCIIYIFLYFLCSVLLLTEASMEKGIREDDKLTSATPAPFPGSVYS